MPTYHLFQYIITLLIILVTGGVALLLSQYRIQEYRSSRLLTLLLLTLLVRAALALSGSPLVAGWSDGLQLAAAPLFLLHLRSLLGDRLSSGRDGYHFAPFFGWVFLSSLPGQLAVILNSWWALFPELFVSIYLVGALVYLRSRLERLKQIRSRLPIGKVRWAQLSLLAWAMVILSGAVRDGGALGMDALAASLVGIIRMGLELVLAVGLAGVGLTRERPVAAVDLKEEAFLLSIADRNEPEPEDIRENASLFKTLDATMQSEKYFFDDDLRLNQLSELMHKKPKEISRAIHHVGGQSFFDYVNGYRALAAQVLMDDAEKQLSLYEIHQASSIESRLVFNATFQRLTGSSPTRYYQLNKKA